MEDKNESLKSNREVFIYELIYPAFLGAMLFEIVPIEFNLKYIIALLIVSYYLLDYCHLYFYLGKRYSKEQKNTFRYTAFDFLVSLSLFIGFRYINQNLNVTILSIASVPIWFLMYSTELKYRENFYWAYLVFGLIGAFSWFILPKSYEVIGAIVYIFAMVITYALFTLSAPKKKNVS